MAVQVCGSAHLRPGKQGETILHMYEYAEETAAYSCIERDAARRLPPGRKNAKKFPYLLKTPHLVWNLLRSQRLPVVSKRQQVPRVFRPRAPGEGGAPLLHVQDKSFTCTCIY